MEEIVALIALSRLPGVKNIVKKGVAEGHEKISPLFEGKVKTDDEALNIAIRAFKGWKEIERDLGFLKRMGATPISIKEKDYPEMLREIPDAPVILYKIGERQINRDAIAIVGSRKATWEGRNLAERIANTLSSMGITVVSGLARGIDAAAHAGSLEEKGGTIAVMGSGTDICYPSENRWLYERIREKGVILTEYSPGERPYPSHFPERNRLIAGLSKGVLVIEASQKSGSLITARLGLEYGREVMAVPGSIFNEMYSGANRLIKDGARLVSEINDIITTCFPDLPLKLIDSQESELDKEEGHIYALIGFDKIHVDEVIEKSRMEPGAVMAVLTRLEMKDAIRSIPGGYYIRR